MLGGWNVQSRLAILLTISLDSTLDWILPFCTLDWILPFFTLDSTLDHINDCISSSNSDNVSISQKQGGDSLKCSKYCTKQAKLYGTQSNSLNKVCCK